MREQQGGRGLVPHTCVSKGGRGVVPHTCVSKGSRGAAPHMWGKGVAPHPQTHVNKGAGRFAPRSVFE